MKNFSSIIFALNEEKRIELLLRNLIPYSEVFILDGGSTDRTREITEKFGGHFVVRPKISTAHVETEEMFQFAKALVKTNWIYWSYVDNILPKNLLEQLSEVAAANKYKCVYVPIYTYMWGETKYPVIKASYLNFFHKEFMDFSGNRIHGLGKFIGNKNEILDLPKKAHLAIRHYSLYDSNKFILGHLRYAAFEAEDKLKHGKKFSVFYMLGSMLHYFWLFYKRGFRVGVKGLFNAFLYAFFRLMMAVRLYELENNLNLETIEWEFQKDKQRLIDEIERR